MNIHIYHPSQTESRASNIFHFSDIGFEFPATDARTVNNNWRDYIMFHSLFDGAKTRYSCGTFPVYCKQISLRMRLENEGLLDVSMRIVYFSNLAVCPRNWNRFWNIMKVCVKWIIEFSMYMMNFQSIQKFHNAFILKGLIQNCGKFA